MTENADTPTYLGDGLYVQRHGWQLELYAHNGLEKTNSVYLDDSTLRSFLAFIGR